MARSWRVEKSPSGTSRATEPSSQGARLPAHCVGGSQLTRCSAAHTSPAEQKHALLAEQVPGPPRRVEPQRPSPGVERHRFFHPGTHHLAELAEILDGAEMDVR